MFRETFLALGLACQVLVLQAAVAVEQLPPASEWIPQDAILVLEFPRPKALLDLVLSPELRAAVTSLPAYQQQVSQPSFQEFLIGIQSLELSLGTDWRTAVRKLLGGGVTLAVSPNDTRLLIMDAEDGQMLEQLHGIFVGIARGEAATQGQPDRVASQQYQGVTGWTFNGREAHAILGSRLLLGNRSGALKAALDLRALADGRGLASLSTYQAAKQAAGADATAVAFVNLAVLKQHPPVQKALSQSGNPLASLLFAGVQEALRGSSWSAMGVEVEEGTLRVRVLVDGTTAGASGPAGFASPSQPGDGALPNLAVPRRIAGLSLYRDLHGFYAAKDELFPQRTGGLIFFENMMGIFFTGRDLTDEVMAEIGPEIRFVVAEQQYDPSVGTPQVQMPAFAAVLRLRNPDRFGEVAEEAWQKAIGLANFTRGQQALPGLIIDRPSHDGVTFTMAYFSSAEEKDRTAVHQRFNFCPSVAKLEDYLILSSTVGLARDLIDALKKQIADSVQPLAQVHSLLEMDGVQLASILRANRESLVRGNMVSKGNTREQAETQAGLIATVAEYLSQAKLSIGRQDGQPCATLDLKPSLPEGGHLEAPPSNQGDAASVGAVGSERR